MLRWSTNKAVSGHHFVFNCLTQKLVDKHPITCNSDQTQSRWQQLSPKPASPARNNSHAIPRYPRASIFSPSNLGCEVFLQAFAGVMMVGLKLLSSVARLQWWSERPSPRHSKMPERHETSTSRWIQFFELLVHLLCHTWDWEPCSISVSMHAHGFVKHWRQGNACWANHPATCFHTSSATHYMQHPHFWQPSPCSSCWKKTIQSKKHMKRLQNTPKSIPVVPHKAVAEVSE